MVTDRNNRRRERCSHPEWRRTSRNFGLERCVCVACGKMEMRNLPDQVVVNAESLRAAAASRI